MFELRVRRKFSAAHAIRMAGQVEPLHGHDWRVSVRVRGERLDGDGLLCDFHALERAVDEVIAPFRNRSLNDTPPFDRTNPTAELVARHIGDALAPRIPSGAHLHSVVVGEAPGCDAVWRPRGRA
jgi:6-pyruvoyltetrahydropterin/6-carboxytetrahydropterin synthase